MTSDVIVQERDAPEQADPVATLDSRLELQDLAALRSAVQALERSTLAGRLSAIAGKPIELIGHAIPEQARALVTEAADRALRAALKVALRMVPERPAGEEPPPRSSGHRATTLVAASGAIGGAFGLIALPLELPISTTLVLRAIAEIAREEGEDLSDPETALSCLQVFALGSRTEDDDLASSGYFAVRATLAHTITQAARVATGKAAADSAPILLKFLSQIAARFGIVVSQKVAAGALPIIGALGGAAVNAAFMAHFRTVARAHFTVRRLERRYGRPAVKSAYEEIRKGL